MSAVFGDLVPNEDRGTDSTASNLLDAAKRMDPQAWCEFVDCYSWLVFQWCCNAGLNGDDAADVLQIVMSQVAFGLPAFQKDGKKAAFRRWLRTITRRKVADFRRAEMNRPHGEGGSAAQKRILAVPDETEGSTSEDPRLAAFRGRFWSLLERLEDEVEESTWQAFWLTMVENRTSIEAGTLLQMTPNAVRLAKGRVLQRLREDAAVLEIEPPKTAGRD
jgi:RNA polymerase sigma-70 factor, ECF subfamily